MRDACAIGGRTHTCRNRSKNATDLTDFTDYNLLCFSAQLYGTLDTASIFNKNRGEKS
jgi:hypothetical protein